MFSPSEFKTGLKLHQLWLHVLYIKFYKCRKTFCILLDKQYSCFYKHMCNISSMNKMMFELCLQTEFYQVEFKNIKKDNGWL